MATHVNAATCKEWVCLVHVVAITDGTEDSGWGNRDCEHNQLATKEHVEELMRARIQSTFGWGYWDESIHTCQQRVQLKFADRRGLNFCKQGDSCTLDYERETVSSGPAKDVKVRLLSCKKQQYEASGAC